jgi:hypothetical protein
MNKSSIARVVLSLAVLTCVASAAAGQGVKPRQKGQTPEAAGDGEAAAPENTERARDLYYTSGAGGAARNVGIRVKLYAAADGCNFVQVSPRTRFTAGQKVRFGVESNSPGYLYIVQRGTSGNNTLLFPNSQVNRDNMIGRGTEIVIPGSAWFTFDNNPGVENLYFIFSKKKMDLITYLVPSVSTQPTPAGVPQSGSAEATVLTLLQGGGGTRDLILSTGGAEAAAIAPAAAFYSFEPTYAVNGNAKGDFLVLPLKLNHQ